MAMRQLFLGWREVVEGCFLVALGIAFLQAGDLTIGATAGLARITQIHSGWSFGLLFWLINLPFYLLGYLQLGAHFTIRSFIAVCLLSLMSEALAMGLTIAIHPLLAAVAAGACIGFGLVIMFRSNASLGGFNVLALFLQKRFAIPAGRTMLWSDALILLLALTAIDWHNVLWSLLVVWIMASMVGRYHDRSALDRFRLTAKKADATSDSSRQSVTAER